MQLTTRAIKGQLHIPQEHPTDSPPHLTQQLCLLHVPHLQAVLHHLRATLDTLATITERLVIVKPPDHPLTFLCPPQALACLFLLHPCHLTSRGLTISPGFSESQMSDKPLRVLFLFNDSHPLYIDNSPSSLSLLLFTTNSFFPLSTIAHLWLPFLTMICKRIFCVSFCDDFRSFDF